jgi:integrase
VTVLRDAVDETGVAIKVPDAKYSLHALRHAAAALFIEQGFPPKKVQALMGHSSIQMTFDLYGYLFPSDDDDRSAMSEIEGRLLSE